MTNHCSPETSELLPCPFCGGDAIMMGIPPRYAPECWVKCSQCASSSDAGQAKQVANNWNTRASVAQSTVPFLWCCHVRGPDDVYAAPDYVTALAWSDALNEINWRGASSLKIENPKSFEDCLIKAVPAPWPYSPELHAENLPKSIAGFTAPTDSPRNEDWLAKMHGYDSPLSSTPQRPIEKTDEGQS
jgi:hypothetical protein